MLTEDWEEMLDETHFAQHDTKSASLQPNFSKEALARLEALKLDESHSLECANDLLDLPQEKPDTVQQRIVSPHTYSIDNARPKTRDDFDEFQTALISKISSFKESSMYGLFIESCIRKLAGMLELNQLRKMTGEMQTLLNQQIAASKTIQAVPKTTSKKGAKPSLKYTSVKTAFDHDLNPYDEDDDYYY